MISKHWTNIILFTELFMQVFDRQQVQSFKITIQSKIKNNMTNLVCMVVLNHDLDLKVSDWKVTSILVPWLWLNQGVYSGATGGICLLVQLMIITELLLWLWNWPDLLTLERSFLIIYSLALSPTQGERALPMESNSGSCEVFVGKTNGKLQIYCGYQDDG